MYTTTSKQQEGCTFEDSHPKCFITTNSTAKLSRGAVNRGDVHVLRASYTKVNSNTVCNYYSACRRRGGVLKCPRFCFFFFFFFFFGVESWAAAHGLYRCTEYRLLSEPMSTRLLNSISSRICRQNTQFNMYTTTSKQQEGCTFKDSHPKCFITTNFDKFHREAFARGGESR